MRDIHNSQLSIEQDSHEKRITTKAFARYQRRMTASELKWVTIKAALPERPLPPNASRSPVTTDRLLIRALVPEDAHSLHMLRTQPEVMANHPQGRADKDLEETKRNLSPFLPPNDETTYNCAICLKET